MKIYVCNESFMTEDGFDVVIGQLFFVSEEADLPQRNNGWPTEHFTSVEPSELMEAKSYE